MRIQKNKPPSTYQDIELDAYKEMLRQARHTFNLHCLGVIVCAAITAGGGYAFLSTGRTVEGAVTGAAGTGAIACFSKLARDSIKDSERKLNRIVKQVKTPS
ncbi:MAG: hypothetical protein DCF25_05960 [Leptolyngbya foveolarum]|uniref:Cyanobacterial TRADD-N associated 2 transmembrane domain-containing protein n=1 Tax=Leptolyngbya foveolarum TaxID=47253 RepID=A0A2W4ULB5_9CYAN|nr:MAG: hypothetical protein DCF25_05960 [Leptolyngbya foveolarum]